jgi:hypothetical protein
MRSKIVCLPRCLKSRLCFPVQLKKLAEKLGPETTELQRFLSQLSGSEFSAPPTGTWNITETVKSATFSPLPRPTGNTAQLQQILGMVQLL